MGDPIPFPGKIRESGIPAPHDAILAAAPRVARICALALGLDELLDEVCKEILALSGAEGCYLVARHEDATRDEIWHSTVPGDWPDLRSVYVRSANLDGVMEQLRAGRVRAVADCDRLPPDDPLRLLHAPRPVRAALLLSLKFGTRLLGLLALHVYSGARAWRDEDVRILSEVAVPVLSAALERRRMEARLRTSESRYRFLADHALDFISLHDPSGTYLYASPAARGMFGYRPEEMMGAAAASFVHPDDRERFLEENRRLASGEIAAVTIQLRVRTKAGGYADVETVSSAVRNERGEVVQALRVTRDITERKMMESRLFESQKLETIGMLAGGVAHEFNNLLVGINGAVEMLGLLLTGNWEARNYLAMIERNGDRAVQLTRQLLAYARQGKYSPGIVLLNKAVTEDATMLKASLPASVELRLDLAEEVPPVLADITQIKQVVMSLCLNAGEAMPDGGILTIRTRRDAGPLAAPPEWEKTGGESAARRLRSGATLTGPVAVLEVSDTGCGMDGKTIGRIFEPFFSTKFIGRGMGLAAVRGIVESHDGEILVCSEPGRGTAISIAFPAAAGTPAEEGTREAPQVGGAATVLVADDEDDVREVVGAMLASFGYRVIEARDGAEAVELFRARHREIDLVLLDLMMPRMTGDRAFSEMRSIFPGARALLASGYDETDRVREIVAAGFKGFIQKPFRRSELGRKVEEVLTNAGRLESPGHD